MRRKKDVENSLSPNFKFNNFLMSLALFDADDFLQENVIPQFYYKMNPLNQGGAAPKITDIATPGRSYELPAPWVEWLEEYGRNAKIMTS